ncbi:glycosyltransferase family 2 protein [Xenorhabdus littoralis]|uniref:glycosyltransferase family 2 protein n=1 Tax=Xenorhabdus littoralis TaxID=2582835 RepID=UPI0029E7EAAD|nr:glycosyltransferase family 2 protein [Xenorhabdus sp. psl]MDX7992000.1 glycosyltransferase family 2 protein [Xenorhabdus sp. psl]
MSNDSINNTKIVGILVSYNPNIKHLLLVLNSISPQIKELIIVDNGSKNHDEIKENCHYISNIIYFHSDTNIGLASAQNIGIKNAINKKASHIILFDQDSVITENFIQNLLDGEKNLLSLGKKVAAVGPSFHDPETQKPYPATIYFGPFIKRVPMSGMAVEATFIISSGSLINTNVLKEIGNMKDELFIDYIDVEWSLRAKSKGYSVFIIPKAKMTHTIGDKRISIFGRTISVHSPLRRYYLIRNSFLISRLSYIPLGYKMRELIFNPIRIFISLFTNKPIKSTLKYSFLAIIDGLKGKSGPFKQL